jgi:hypothetical protein
VADYGCYKIPPGVALCGGSKVTSGTPCSAPPCQVCGGVGGYQDSGGTVKDGYCVCSKVSSLVGNYKWSCANTKEWPCPSGNGCT